MKFGTGSKSGIFFFFVFFLFFVCFFFFLGGGAVVVTGDMNIRAAILCKHDT